MKLFSQDLDFGLSVLSTLGGSQRTSVGIMTRASTTFMPNWDVPGWDYFSVPGITNSLDCQHAFGNTELGGRLDLYLRLKQSETKQQQQQLVWVYTNRTLSQRRSGASRDPLAGTIWLESESLNDQWFLELNIFIDHSVVEVFEP
ncbi:unnamed protein product [Rotaria socialis]|uniref:Uncharacterized protein n=1 Tax=Rotaria socialis TaxID=392032 RepID=A0A818S4E5_9BILA|nr:unnamed protein product [Rotaria socialis]CAF4697138.1 unnamed protein product [Rotaria socialis]